MGFYDGKGYYRDKFSGGYDAKGYCATVAKADLTTKEFGVTQVKEDTTVWAYIDHRVKVATIQREFSETALRAGR